MNKWIMFLCVLHFDVAHAAAQTPPQDLGVGWEYFKKAQFTEAFAPLKEKAEQGLPEAQYAVGWMYQLGKGVAMDKQAAIGWYQKAADKGHLSSQNNLCAAYLDRMNFTDALPWCEKAAGQQHPRAQFLLAMMHYNGQGTAKDAAESAGWLTKSADQGYAASEYKLGLYYSNGIGVKRDLAEAKKYLERAAAKKYRNAAEHLQCLNQAKAGACDALPVY
ncbi:MAG: tetratricopeptide repeat protein [Burkholderiales bacterium]